jgi:hypothetical protein
MRFTKAELMNEMLGDFQPYSDDDFSYFVDENGNEFLVGPYSDVYRVSENGELVGLDEFGVSPYTLSSEKVGKVAGAIKKYGSPATKKAGEYASKAVEKAATFVGDNPKVTGALAAGGIAAAGLSALAKRRKMMKANQSAKKSQKKN